MERTFGAKVHPNMQKRRLSLFSESHGTSLYHHQSGSFQKLEIKFHLTKRSNQLFVIKYKVFITCIKTRSASSFTIWQWGNWAKIICVYWLNTIFIPQIRLLSKSQAGLSSCWWCKLLHQQQETQEWGLKPRRHQPLTGTQLWETNRKTWLIPRAGTQAYM